MVVVGCCFVVINVFYIMGLCIMHLVILQDVN